MNIAYAEPVFMALLHSTVFLQLLFEFSTMCFIGLLLCLLWQAHYSIHVICQ